MFFFSIFYCRNDTNKRRQILKPFKEGQKAEKTNVPSVQISLWAHCSKKLLAINLLLRLLTITADPLLLTILLLKYYNVLNSYRLKHKNPKTGMWQIQTLFYSFKFFIIYCTLNKILGQTIGALGLSEVKCEVNKSYRFNKPYFFYFANMIFTEVDFLLVKALSGMNWWLVEMNVL